MKFGEESCSSSCRIPVGKLSLRSLVSKVAISLREMSRHRQPSTNASLDIPCGESHLKQHGRATSDGLASELLVPQNATAVMPWLLIITFSVFRVPPWLPLFTVESNGVDPSWQMLLNQAIRNGWVFGRDLFFTYGPFGFIHARMFHPETWSVLIAAWAGIAVIMADLVWRVTGHGRLTTTSRTLWSIALIELISRDAMAMCFNLHALIYLEAVHSLKKQAGLNSTESCSSPQGFQQRKYANIQSTAKALRTFASVRLHAASVHSRSYFRQALPILLLATLPWAKFSYFVTAALLGIALFSADYLQRRFPWRATLLLVACPLAWTLTGGTLDECLEFISMGFQLTIGYSAAMGLGPDTSAGGMVVISTGFVVLLLPVWLSLRLHHDDRRQRVLTSLFFWGLLFIVWKSFFVRWCQADRIPAFLGTVLPLIIYGFVARFADRRPSRTIPHVIHEVSRWFTGPALLAVMLVVISAASVEAIRPLTVVGLLGEIFTPAQDQLRAVVESVKDPEWRNRIHETQLAEIRKSNPIPQVDGTLDVFPSRLAIAFAHHLKLKPRPLPQSYTAYTPELIERNAEHFRGPQAPDHVLMSIGEIDGRLPTMEDSQAWFELLSNYELADAHYELLQLRRRGRPFLTLSQEPILRKTCRWGETVSLPESLTGPVWCRIQITPALPGRVASILYRLPEIRLHVRVYQDEPSLSSFRLIPESAESGFLISPLAETRDDLIALWRATESSESGHSTDGRRVASIACEFAGNEWNQLMFESNISVEFFGISTLPVRP